MDDTLTPLEGLTVRALTVDNVDDAVALTNTCEMHDVGYTMLDRGDLTSDFRLPGFDPQADSVGIWEDTRLVGWGYMPKGHRAWIDVHPDARGRGIGTWLRRWSERRARDRGAASVEQTINDRAADAIRLLVAARYTPRSTSWILSMEHPERPADPAPPESITLRTFRPGDEEEALGVFEDAFNGSPGRQSSMLATWRSQTIEREGFTAEDMVLALEGGEIVGVAFLIDSDEIWVDKLAVRRDHRHRGIARALLQVAFQRGFERGYASTSLSTDSGSGALTLYERVGMHIRESYTNHAIDL